MPEAIGFAKPSGTARTINVNIPEAQKSGGVWTLQLATALPDLIASENITGARTSSASSPEASCPRLIRVLASETEWLDGACSVEALREQSNVPLPMAA